MDCGEGARLVSAGGATTGFRRPNILVLSRRGGACAQAPG